MEGTPIAIVLTSTNGLFTRLGRIGGRINSLLNQQGAGSLTAPSVSAGTFYTNMLAQFTSTAAQSDVFDGFVPNVLNVARVKPTEITNLKTLAQTLLVRQVDDDTQLKQYTVPYAIEELIRQMNVPTTTYVTGATVGVGSIVAGTSNTGTATATASVTGPNGVAMQFVVPETVTLKCNGDSYTGGRALYSESFSVIGNAPLVPDPLAWNYTSVFGATSTNGSGGSISMTVCNAALYASSAIGANMLNNGDFLTFAANVPNQWTLTVGVAGTNIADGGAGTGVIAGGSHSLSIIGDGSTLTALKQQIGNSGGTVAAAQISTAYAWNMWLKATSGTTGTLIVDLVDGTSTVINDANGTANSASISLATLTTSYAAFNGYFRTPAILPSTGVFIRIRLSVAANAAHTVSVSNFAMCAATRLYSSGPFIGLFSGATGSVFADVYSIPITNDYGNLTNKLGFQQVFNYLFGLATIQMPNGSVGVQLPISGTTNIPDSSVS